MRPAATGGSEAASRWRAAWCRVWAGFVQPDNVQASAATPIDAACAVLMAMNTWAGIDEMGELTPPPGVLALRRG